MPTIEQAHNWYPDEDGVHGFAHVLRVYHLAERLARAENADLEIVRAAALLHDIDSSQLAGNPYTRQQHHQASADFAGQVLAQEGWPAARIIAVQHAIRAHRFRGRNEQPQTLEAKILFDADKLDAIGAIGTVRALAYAFLAGQPAYQRPSSRFARNGEKEPGEAHSAYHEYIFKLRKLNDRLFTPSARQLALKRHHLMVEFFEQLKAEIEGQA